jgi:hypothetical protein
MLKELRSGDIINTDKIESIKRDSDGNGYYTGIGGYMVDLTPEDVKEIMEIVNGKKD